MATTSKTRVFVQKSVSMLNNFPKLTNFSKSFINAIRYPNKSQKNYNRYYSFINSRTLHNIKTIGVISSGIATGIGIGYGIFTFGKHFKENKTLKADTLLIHPTKFSVRSNTDITGLKLTLYQYATCPFCCKVRAYLDYHGFSYDIVEVNSVTRKELKWSEKYKKVPILIIEKSGSDGFVQLNDSSVIMSVLETYLLDKRQELKKVQNFYPILENKEGSKIKYEFPNKYFVMYGDQYKPNENEEFRKIERKWRKWTDDTLVHTLSPNIYRTPSEALQAFNWFSEAGNWREYFSTFERVMVIYVGSVAMYVIGKVLKKRHNLPDDVRLALYDAVKDWTKELDGKPFHGGKTPDLADLSAYGYLNAMEGCLAFKDLEKETSFRNWYDRMKITIKRHEGASKMASA